MEDLFEYHYPAYYNCSCLSPKETEKLVTDTIMEEIEHELWCIGIGLG